MAGAQPNLSLINGLAVLQAVTAAGKPLGTRELGRLLGLTHTRANRLLLTLAELGLVAQDAQRKYRPGPGIHVLAAQGLVGSRLLPAALPVLRELHREEITVALGVLWRGHVCYLLHARPGRSLDEAIGGHQLWPARHSSLGIALLATAGESALEDPERPSPLDSGQDVEQALAAARRDGHAALRYRDGTISLGVAIGDPAVAGLAVSHPRLQAEQRDALIAELHAAADRILSAVQRLAPSPLEPVPSQGILP